MILEQRPDLPLREPVSPCAGWLAHNTQHCDCYAEERARARAASTKHFDPIALMADAMRLAGASEQGISNAQLDRLRAPMRCVWIAVTPFIAWMAISILFQIGGPAS